MSNDLPVRIDVFFGRIEMQSRMRRDGLRLIGEGRSLNYNGDGKLVSDSGWQPTGAMLTAPDLKTVLMMEAICARP